MMACNNHIKSYNVEFHNATCIFVYLVPEGMKAIQAKLADAYDNNVRIISYIFSIPTLVPNEVILFKNITKIYYYNKIK